MRRSDQREPRTAGNPASEDARAEELNPQPLPPSTHQSEWRDLDVDEQRLEAPLNAGTPPGMTRKDVQGRFELARHLEPHVFPADAKAIRDMAAATAVPQSLQDDLERLPDAVYADVNEVWTALGHGVEDSARRT